MVTVKTDLCRNLLIHCDQQPQNVPDCKYCASTAAKQLAAAYFALVLRLELFGIEYDGIQLRICLNFKNIRKSWALRT